MSVCIVGAAGFIGQNLARALPDAVSLTRKDLDLLDAEATRNYFASRHFDTIIHCACTGGRRTKKDDLGVFTDNIDMFENVYKNADFYRFIWFSSGATDIADSPYGHAKKYIEARTAGDPRVNIYKLWGCFGPGEASHRFFTSGISNGNLVIERDRYFDFVHVDDLITLISNSNYKLVHVVYPEKFKLSELAEMAGIPFTISDTSVMDPPYIGEPNAILDLPPLKDRITAFCRTSSSSEPGTCQAP
jgi:nucleoside-diphosphate-sugar epimerase